jgi:hypothetical protein
MITAQLTSGAAAMMMSEPGTAALEEEMPGISVLFRVESSLQFQATRSAPKTAAPLTKDLLFIFTSNRTLYPNIFSRFKID